jgi:hypothetical protein
VSENCIDEMASVILTGKGQVIIRKSIWGLSANDLIDECINSKINTSIASVISMPPKYLFNSEDDELIEPLDEGLASLGLQDTTPAELDEYLMAQLLIPVGGERVPAKVLKQKLDLDDNLIGT